MNAENLDRLLNKARELYEQDKNYEAAELARQIIEQAEAVHNYLAKALGLNTLGTTFFNQNLLEEALENYLAAEKILSAIGEEKQTVPALINIAIIYNRQQLFSNAISTYERALELMKAEHISMLHAQIHNGIGNVYSECGEHQKAFFHFKQVLKISQQLEIDFGIALGLSNMACVAIKLNQPELANDLALQTLSISEKQDFAMVSLTAKAVVADALLLQKKFNESILKYQQLIPEMEAVNRDDMLQEAYRNLIHAYIKLKDFEAAFYTSKKLESVTAKLNSIERTKVLNAMQVRFETEKKEIAIRELQINNERMQRRKVEAELQSLRSRMNPHFVYNVMNTIQGLIHLDKKEEAMKAVEGFAQLNRITLEHSSVAEVTVQQEVLLLKNYIETEQLLMGKSFSFSIEVDENIEQDFTFLPSLLVQPFVENAIKHGLMHKADNQQLSITITTQNSTLNISVKDNGIGRNASAEKNSAIFSKPKSFATSAIEARIALLNEARDKHIQIITKDLFDNLQQPSGTEVVIIVPFQE